MSKQKAHKKSKTRTTKHSSPTGSPILLAGLIGFIISVFYIWSFSPSWAFAFGVFFACLIGASFVQMNREAQEV